MLWFIVLMLAFFPKTVGYMASEFMRNFDKGAKQEKKEYQAKDYKRLEKRTKKLRRKAIKAKNIIELKKGN